MLRTAGVLLLGLAAATGLTACKDKAPAEAEVLRPVRTLVLEAGDVNLVGEFPAEIRPRVDSALGFRVAGKILERRVQAGQEVKRGQVLARIDASDLRLNESASRAQLAAAEVDRKQKQADLARYDELRRKGFISAAEFESRRTAAEASQAQYEQARAGLSVQTNQADYAVLTAPADGVVTSVDAEVGQVVAAGQSVMHVAGSADKEAAFQIPENRVDQVRGLNTADVTLWSGGPPMKGVIREISGSADPLTRAFAARLRLIDPPPSVRFGMTATVRFAGRSAQPLVRVPLSALLRQDDQTWVWVFSPDTGAVTRTPVRLATVTDTEALLESTLPARAEIVTAGVHLLREGQRVKRLETVAAPGVAAASSASTSTSTSTSASPSSSATNGAASVMPAGGASSTPAASTPAASTPATSTRGAPR